MRDPSLSRYLCLALLPLTSVMLTGVSRAQDPDTVTKATVKVFAKKAQGNGNQVENANGTITYCYDSSTGMLDVTIANTTEQKHGSGPNPVITNVYFNLPYLAVTGATLVDQSLAGGGAVIPMNVTVDTDSLHDPSPVRSPGWGRLNIQLSTDGGPEGGIANPDATRWAVRPSRLNIGPMTFSFELQGPNLGSLTARTFATTPSVPPPSTVATAVFHFQGGGRRGPVATLDGCIPGLWWVGDPCTGNTITFLRASAPGCHGCLVFSTDPTPIVMAGINVPISPPYVVVAPAIASNSIEPLDIQIPDDPALVGMTGYFVFAVTDPVLGPQFSEVVPITVCGN